MPAVCPIPRLCGRWPAWWCTAPIERQASNNLYEIGL
jgi:hypothetical protein